MGEAQQWLEWVALQEKKHQTEHIPATQTWEMPSFKGMLRPSCCIWILPRNGPEKDMPHCSIQNGMQS